MSTAERQPDSPAAHPLDDLVDELVASYVADDRMQHLGATFLPSRGRTIDIIELLRRVIFPGFFDDSRITPENVRFHAGDLLSQLHDALYEQIRKALRYEKNLADTGSGDECELCDQRAAIITNEFLSRLPSLRQRLALDVQATFDGDPAAQSTDETIFCYPGIDAIFTHRIAHELFGLKVPLLPRMMSEYAHNETGIDIHPGATIGESFCIDHGTGIVIGETTTIGARVKIYQGVTLGALSTKGGQRWAGRKRHPAIEDDVTIYGGAIILGGETVIGEGAVIGGSVFITNSIPAGHTVTMAATELVVTPRKGWLKKKQKGRDGEASDEPMLDFQI